MLEDLNRATIAELCGELPTSTEKAILEFSRRKAFGPIGHYRKEVAIELVERLGLDTYTMVHSQYNN
jgi:hypothetical protein